MKKNIMKQSYLILTVIGIVILTILLYNQSNAPKNKTTPMEEIKTNPIDSQKIIKANSLLTENNSNNNYQYHGEAATVELTEKGNFRKSGFNFLAAWDSFEVKNYSAAADILAFSELYLSMEGEDLKDENAKHLTATIKNINQLSALLIRSGKKDDTLIASSFSDSGLNLGKIYLAISIGMIKNDNDSRYFFSKTIVLLEKVIPTLKDDEKKKVEQIFRDLIKYKKELKEGTATSQQLKEINERFHSVLEKRKVYF